MAGVAGELALCTREAGLEPSPNSHRGDFSAEPPRDLTPPEIRFQTILTWPGQTLRCAVCRAKAEKAKRTEKPPPGGGGATKNTLLTLEGRVAFPAHSEALISLTRRKSRGAGPQPYFSGVERRARGGGAHTAKRGPRPGDTRSPPTAHGLRGSGHGLITLHSELLFVRFVLYRLRSKYDGGVPGRCNRHDRVVPRHTPC